MRNRTRSEKEGPGVAPELPQSAGSDSATGSTIVSADRLSNDYGYMLGTQNMVDFDR